MKKVTIKKIDAYDLAAVMGTVVKEHSEKLEFKEILHIQKSVNAIIEKIKDYVEKFDALTKEKNGYLEAANAKIVSYRQELQKKGEVTETTSQEMEEFVNRVKEDTEKEINAEMTPEYKKLFDEIGNTDVELEFEEDKLKLFVEKFETYAKELYLNKNKMIETYEKLTSAAE